MSKNDNALQNLLKFSPLKKSIWYLGNSAWLFGMVDRTMAALGDGYFSAFDLIGLSTASFFFIGWLFLKPNGTLN